MARPRSTTTKPRTRRKAAPPVPELEAMVDTLSDEINPDEVKAPRASRQKPGPKKVLNETSKIIGDGLAVGVLFATQQPDARKNLTMPEAQSIGHPIARMLGRRLPNWLKPLLPKTKLSPDDAADLEEIAATFAKWSLRLLTIMIQDAVEARESAKKGTQSKTVLRGDIAVQRPSVELPSVPLEAMPRVSLADMRKEQAQPIIAQPIQNGHNPAFDVLNNIDLGVEV